MQFSPCRSKDGLYVLILVARFTLRLNSPRSRKAHPIGEMSTYCVTLTKKTSKISEKTFALTATVRYDSLTTEVGSHRVPWTKPGPSVTINKILNRFCGLQDPPRIMFLRRP